MTRRHKNMLEAFSASAEQMTPQSGEPAAAPSAEPPRRPRAKSALPDVSTELFAGILCVLVIGAFFLGRWSVSTTVRAADETTTGTRASEMDVAEIPESVEAMKSTATMGISTIAGEPVTWSIPTELRAGTVAMVEANSVALADKKNLVTVRVDSFDNNESGRREALKSALYLSSLDFPAMSPIELGGDIFLCVGAAPSSKDEELLRMMRELHQLPGPPPSNRFGNYGDAYLDNIDNLLNR